ncbi:MAG: chemotaxis protein CheX [Chitinivibrionales bacterium]|nr:chemotaxis protein CheX [Chitinivibrionales bacterium]
MDVSYVNPFIQATVETFKTMLNIEVSMGVPILRNDAKHSYDVSGVIGLTGEAQGVISISFPKPLALRVVSKLLGEEIKIIGTELTDGVGEIANIVAGHAKQYLTKYKLSISLPNVVIGTGHRIEVQTGVPTIIVPLKCDLGEFAMEIALKTK